MSDYFRAGPGWAVTATRVETPKKDFDIDSITAIEISRVPMWSAIALLVGVLLASLVFRHILYPSEIAASVGLAALLVGIASQIGWMRVSGSSWRGTETGRVWGRIGRLHAMRIAIRRAQEDLHRSGGSREA